MKKFTFNDDNTEEKIEDHVDHYTYREEEMSRKVGKRTQHERRRK